MLRKSVSCAKVLVSLHPVGGSRWGLPAGLLSAACRPVSRAVAAMGQGLYLDVSMFSSLKLPQCSITFLETTGEHWKAGWGRLGHVPPC